MRWWLVMPALLAGCATVPAEVLPPTKLSSGQVATVHARLRKDLKDPESARFGPMRAGRTVKGNLVVCGWLNAKNAYGGYVGDSPYLGEFPPGSSSFEPILFGSGDAQIASIIGVQCANNGVPLPPR